MARKTNMFEQASRKKLRISTPQGQLSVEDLWDLPLTGSGANLDDIARSFSRTLKAQAEESFVVKPARKSSTVQLGFDIVKHVIGVRLAENEAKKDAEERRKRKARIADIIVQKQDQALTEKSLEELEAELEQL